MIDFDILKAFGTSDERLKEIFTAVPYPDSTEVTDEDREKRDEDLKIRKKFETLIQDRQMEHISFSLSNHRIYSAVDLAWDSVPITPATYPLMLYAQGKIDIGSCATQLADLNCSEQFVVKDENKKVTGINLPKFTDVTVNLVRSFVTRRLAAQSNKYNSLYPYYKYESRGTSAVAKLRSDVMSQRADIMADQFDHRHHDVQVMRDMLLYATSVDFVRTGWECEKQWRKKPLAEEFVDPERIGKDVDDFITREGIAFTNPHPSRIFWDNAYPLPSINTDTGCEYIGYWDVVRYREVALNTEYWNRDKLSYNSNIVNLFSTYAQYFSQYYCTITPPSMVSDPSGQNDLKSGVGLYAGTEMDSSMIISYYNQKLVPKDHGLGEYPHPVWVRFIVSGDGTVIHAKVLPSTPAVAASYNCKDDRRLNLSVAHELMAYQDHMTNLLSYLLLCLSTDNFKVVVVNTDPMTPEALKAFRAKAKGANYYNEPLVLEVSISKMEGLGVNMSKVVEMIETRNSAAIDVIFKAMLQLLQMVERLMALSPQEQGQPAAREISATETNLIAGTTESVYGFISDSVDEMRAAKKRIIYESLICCGADEFRIPAIDRYSRKVIEMAGFEVVDEESEMPNDPTAPQRHTIIGTKSRLIHAYIFTTRDGAERSVNTQAANVLVQLLGILQNPIIAQAVGKEKLFEIVNEIFRLSGAGIDLKLEVREGEDDAVGADANAQIQQVLEQITTQLEQQGKAIQTIGQQAQQQAEAGQKLAEGVSQDVTQFKQSMIQTLKDLDHQHEIEILRLKEQMKTLMRQVMNLARLEKAA